jgi:O-antigen ligase
MPERGSPPEIVCLGLLLVYLFWLPLPFGSVIERAQPALILPPLLICAAAAFLRARVIPSARNPQPAGDPSPSARLGMTPAARFWAAGAMLFALVVALQLVPLPNALLGALSPESLRLWSAAERVASLAGVGPPSANHPISVDPATTSLQLFRLLAYIATFFAAMLLVRRNRHRAALAFVLGGAAVFETLYGVREAALQRYAIWGWANKLIFNRVTGTFVNPNHFAHYAAIVLPLGVYLSAQAWRDAAPAGAPLRLRVVRLFEKRLLRFGCGLIVAFACLVAILVAQSRGALVAAVGGFAIVGAIASGPRHALRRAALIALAGISLAIVIAAFLGLNASRFQEPEVATLGGRAIPVKAAFELWKRFPLFGSGLGTFVDVSSMTGAGGPDILINHAHDDYAEIAATTGIAGFLAALVPLFAGYAALARMTFGRRAAEASWMRRAFQAAALTSITIALLHALIDFNFFIPANPATLAAIAGAAVGIREPR